MTYGFVIWRRARRAIMAGSASLLPLSALIVAGTPHASPSAYAAWSTSMRRADGPDRGTRDAHPKRFPAVSTPVQEGTASPKSTVLPTTTPVGTGTALPSPTATSSATTDLEVSVLAARIEPRKARPDWDLSTPSMAAVRTGTGVTLSIYYTIANGRPTDVIVDQWTVRDRKGIIWRTRHAHLLGRPTRDLFRDHVMYTFRRRGAFSYVGRVILGRLSDAGIADIKVLRAKRHQ